MMHDNANLECQCELCTTCRESVAEKRSKMACNEKSRTGHADVCADRQKSNTGQPRNDSRGSVLAEAMGVINGERQDQYGNPEDSFELVARYWNVYLESKGILADYNGIVSDDVAMLMALFKVAREAKQHKRDNIVDAAGYLGLYADMVR